jgi:fructose-1,6-bisphosphatase/inositol monophosphatase family enzyme
VAITTYLHPPRLLNATLRDGLIRAIAGAASVRIIGSGSIELAAVAAGRLGVWLHADPPLWDWLPGAALVLGLGGTTAVFEHGGHRWHAAGPATAVAQTRAAVLGQG